MTDNVVLVAIGGDGYSGYYGNSRLDDVEIVDIGDNGIVCAKPPKLPVGIKVRKFFDKIHLYLYGLVLVVIAI